MCDQIFPRDLGFIDFGVLEMAFKFSMAWELRLCSGANGALTRKIGEDFVSPARMFESAVNSPPRTMGAGHVSLDGITQLGRIQL